MKITDIERVKLGTLIEIPTDELSQSTLQDAKELLGYVPGQEKPDAQNPLYEAMAGLGIEILDWRKVLLYQAEMCHESRLKKLAGENELPQSRVYAWQEWQQTPLKEWKQPIPIHVIEKANQIKRRCPDVQFFIEALQDTPDPFLVATLQHPQHSWVKSEYYIEVWEEPKFQ